MDFLAPVRRFDRFQQTKRGLAIPLAVIRKFSNDQAGNLAALMSYYGFFSLFPLLLVFTTILGFVLQGDPSAQKSVENSVLGQLPLVGNEISTHSLSGSTVALVLGLLTALWAGLGVTNAAQNALNTVWAIPFKRRPNFIKSRLRGIGLLVSLGLLFIVSTAASGIVSGGFGGAGEKIAGYVLALALNFGLFMASYRFMTVSEISTRDLVIGAAVASVLWTILQSVGGYYIGHVEKGNRGTYGTFATVIALLVWLHLGAQIFLYCAEINTVIKRRLWPRSLFGPPESAADQRTLRALAKVEERSEEQQVDVQFATKTDPQADGAAETDREAGAAAPERRS
ncbi:MAG: YihY/virulence factor BrkB family protein [Solirubrobacteraceae bacterium]